MTFMLLAISVLCAAAMGFERLAGSSHAKSASLNAVCGFWQLVFTHLCGPVLAPLLVWAGGRFGKHPFHLSGHGWALPVSVFILLAATDLADYSFHRVQHKVSWLWAMHSFHHSDSTMNATTAYRAYWLERPLVALFYAPLAFLFKADDLVIAFAGLIGWIIPIFHHMNVRLGFARVPWLLVTPQFHRMHHSTERRHFDTNFAGFLPIWDMLFGTYATPEDFPPTGLQEGEPQNLKEALLWPFLR